MELPAFLTNTLPELLTPATVGVLVGALVGVMGFVIVLVIVMRPKRVMIAPYPTMQKRNTPLPPLWVAEPHFVPSSELSARALAKMGFPLGPMAEQYAPSCPTEILPILRPSEPKLQPKPKDDSIFANVDDSPTQVCETWFDTVAPPRTMGSRPKIRAIAPLPPRFPHRSP